MPFFSYLNDYSDITDILLRNTRRYGKINAFTDMVLRGKSELRIADRELLAAYVSALNACQYCTGIHEAVALRFGIQPNTIEDLLKAIDDSPIEKKLHPIFYFAKKLTLSPAKMVQDDADQVFAAGWSEKALEDVIAIVALFNYYNRLLEGHGIKGFPDIFQEGSKHLAKRGYRFPAIVAFYFKHFRKRKTD